MQQNIFVVEEHLQDLCQVKQQIQDKTTHHVSQQGNKQPNYFNPLQSSPQRNAFFLTSNSPKPFFFDLNHHTDDNNRKNNKNSYQSVICINNKINLYEDNSMMQQEQSQEIQQSEQYRPKKTTPNRSIKNAKGLRNLSESVYKIVSQLSVTKYKEVADRLVSLIAKQQPSSSNINKDQHNIKRRVYDALNVLIAAGLLRKQGKQVACNEPFREGKKVGFNNCKQARQKLKLENDLLSKYQTIHAKRQKLNKIRQRKNIIQYAINRNKHQQKKKQILQFPLVCCTTLNSSIMLQQTRTDTAYLKFVQKPQIYGDVDLLSMINPIKLQQSEYDRQQIKEEQIKMDFLI